MKYCDECGHELIEKPCGIDGTMPYCEHCQKFKFPMFNSAISAIIFNPQKDKVLLIQTIWTGRLYFGSRIYK